MQFIIKYFVVSVKYIVLGLIMILILFDVNLPTIFLNYFFDLLLGLTLRLLYFKLFAGYNFFVFCVYTLKGVTLALNFCVLYMYYALYFGLYVAYYLIVLNSLSFYDSVMMLVFVFFYVVVGVFVNYVNILYYQVCFLWLYFFGVMQCSYYIAVVCFYVCSFIVIVFDFFQNSLIYCYFIDFEVYYYMFNFFMACRYAVYFVCDFCTLGDTWLQWTYLAFICKAFLNLLFIHMYYFIILFWLYFACFVFNFFSMAFMAYVWLLEFVVYYFSFGQGFVLHGFYVIFVFFLFLATQYFALFFFYIKYVLFKYYVLVISFFFSCSLYCIFFLKFDIFAWFNWFKTNIKNLGGAFVRYNSMFLHLIIYLHGLLKGWLAVAVQYGFFKRLRLVFPLFWSFVIFVGSILRKFVSFFFYLFNFFKESLLSDDGLVLKDVGLLWDKRDLMASSVPGGYSVAKYKFIPLFFFFDRFVLLYDYFVIRLVFILRKSFGNFGLKLKLFSVGCYKFSNLEHLKDFENLCLLGLEKREEYKVLSGMLCGYGVLETLILNFVNLIRNYYVQLYIFIDIFNVFKFKFFEILLVYESFLFSSVFMFNVYLIFFPWINFFALYKACFLRYYNLSVYLAGSLEKQEGDVNVIAREKIGGGLSFGAAFADKAPSSVAFFKNNAVFKYSFSHFLFKKNLFILFYNNSFFNFYLLLLYKRFFNFDLFKNEILHLHFGIAQDPLLDIERVPLFEDCDGFDLNGFSMLKTYKILNRFNSNLTLFNLNARLFEISNLNFKFDLNITNSHLVEDFLLFNTYFMNVNFFYEYFDLERPQHDYDTGQVLDEAALDLVTDSLRVYKYCDDADFDYMSFINSFNFVDNTDFFFFSELGGLNLNQYVLPFLYDIVFFFSKNNYYHNYVNFYLASGNLLLLNNEAMALHAYILDNLKSQTCTLWDIYFYFLYETFDKYIYKNRYLKNVESISLVRKYTTREFPHRNAMAKHEFKKFDISAADFFEAPSTFLFFKNKFWHLRKFAQYFYDIFFEDIETVELFRYFKAKKDFKKFENSYFHFDNAEREFIDNYSNMADLEFYIDYNTLYRMTYFFDQDVFIYLYFENAELPPIKGLNDRFFKFLDTNLLPPVMYENYNRLESYHLDFADLEYNNLPYMFYNYKSVGKNFLTTEPMSLLSEEEEFQENFDMAEDITIYSNTSFNYPVDGFASHMVNVIDYTGLQSIGTYKNLDLYLYSFFFDYYYYSLKMLLLDYILFYEYNIFLPTSFFFGPIQMESLSLKKLTFYERCLFVFNKLLNYFLDIGNFEAYVYDFGFFGCKIYYGFFFQLPFFIFFYMLKFFLLPNWLINLYNLNIKEHFDTKYTFRNLGDLVGDLFLLFGDFNFLSYVYRDTDEYEGYFDQDFIVPPSVFNSLGFNSFLVDLDNRYFLNDGYLSTIFAYNTVGFLSFYLYLAFFYDCFILFVIRWVVFVYSVNERLFSVLKIFFYFIEFILFVFFSGAGFLLMFIQLLFLWVYVRLDVLCKFFFNFFGLVYVCKFLYYFNFVAILPFEICRYLFCNLYNFFYVNFYVENRYVGKYLHFLYDCVFKLFYYAGLLFIKLCLIYFCIIGLFDNYDFIILNIERYTVFSFSYRTIFVFYAMLFFILAILILRPVVLSGYLWSFRYFFLFILYALWMLSSWVNSVDLYFSFLWDVIVNNARAMVYGPDFYSKFLHKVNHELIWTNKTRSIRFFDDWYHHNLYRPYRYKFYYSDILFSFYKPLLYNLDAIFDLRKTLLNAKLFYGEIFLNSTVHLFQSMSKFLISVNPNAITTFFLYSYTNPLDKKMYFFANFESQAIAKTHIMFFSYWYSLFTINFFVLNEFLFYKTVIATSPIFGNSFGFLNLNYLEDLKVFRFVKLSYYKHMLEFLRINLWGNYKVPASGFFMFYRRKWFMSEKHFLYISIYKSIQKGQRLRAIGNSPALKGIPADIFLVYDEPMHGVAAYDKPMHWNTVLPIKRHNSYIKLQANYQVKHRFNYSLFYSKYLLPDIGFIGSSNWGVKWKYLSFDTSLKNDSLYVRTGRRRFRRHW